MLIDEILGWRNNWLFFVWDNSETFKSCRGTVASQPKVQMKSAGMKPAPDMKR